MHLDGWNVVDSPIVGLEKSVMGYKTGYLLIVNEIVPWIELVPWIDMTCGEFVLAHNEIVAVCRIKQMTAAQRPTNVLN